MRRKFLVLGLLLAVSTLGVAAVPVAAHADPTCYTGCAAPTTGSSTTPVTVAPTLTTSPPIEPKTATTSGGLALTGADIGGMATIGAGALMVGGLMVRRSRRHRAIGLVGTPHRNQ